MPEWVARNLPGPASSTTPLVETGSNEATQKTLNKCEKREHKVSRRLNVAEAMSRWIDITVQRIDYNSTFGGDTTYIAVRNSRSQRPTGDNDVGG